MTDAGLVGLSNAALILSLEGIGVHDEVLSDAVMTGLSDKIYSDIRTANPDLYWDILYAIFRISWLNIENPESEQDGEYEFGSEYAEVTHHLKAKEVSVNVFKEYLQNDIWRAELIVGQTSEFFGGFHAVPELINEVLRFPEYRRQYPGIADLDRQVRRYSEDYCRGFSMEALRIYLSAVSEAITRLRDRRDSDALFYYYDSPGNSTYDYPLLWLTYTTDRPFNIGCIYDFRHYAAERQGSISVPKSRSDDIIAHLFGSHDDMVASFEAVFRLTSPSMGYRYTLRHLVLGTSGDPDSSTYASLTALCCSILETLMREVHAHNGDSRMMVDRRFKTDLTDYFNSHIEALEHLGEIMGADLR
ncbi:MAG: hypothetical protein AWU57_55 [Marinobacter sp. T13-3]|nr:MAG: hypothetical protein AWU57_55 [Marinobacter sp. T13-3]